LVGVVFFFFSLSMICDNDFQGAIVKEYMEKNYQEDNPQLKGKTAKEEMIKKLGGEVMKCPPFLSPCYHSIVFVVLIFFVVVFAIVVVIVIVFDVVIVIFNVVCE